MSSCKLFTIFFHFTRFIHLLPPFFIHILSNKENKLSVHIPPSGLSDNSSYSFSDKLVREDIPSFLHPVYDIQNMLFGVGVPAISKHLKNIFDSGELEEKATTEKISVVRQEGAREVNRSLQFYNLDAVICVGYRVNSIRATQFRQWATSVLREFAIRGYVLDKKRMENGSFLGEDG